MEKYTYCEKCETDNSLNADFCRNCGHPLSAKGKEKQVSDIIQGIIAIPVLIFLFYLLWCLFKA